MRIAINFFFPVSIIARSAFFFPLTLLCFINIAEGQYNLVLNGNMEEIDSYSKRDKGLWAWSYAHSIDSVSEDPLDHPCHNVVTKYWDTIDTRGRYAQGNESHSGKYYRQITGFQQFDQTTYQVTIDRAQLRKPLKRGNHYNVSLWVMPLNGNIYYDKLSLLLSDSLYDPIESFIDIKESQKYDGYFGNEYLRHKQPLKKINGYTKVSFDYTAHGGERYVYIGDLDVVFPKNLRVVSHYPDPKYSFICKFPYVILAIDDLEVIPMDSSEMNTYAIESSTEIPMIQASFNQIDTLPVYTYYFPTDEYKIDPKMLTIFDSICRTQKFDSILLVGHTDSVGSELYNKNLSLKRAEFVSSQISQKCSTGLIKRGLGSSDPIEKKSDSKLNRRVNVYLIKNLHKL